jgi:glyoxylase-like metal-dependent hydrolase (beta-lactamase superfamily II)
MKPATRLRQITKNLCGWSSFHPQWKIDFDSYALRTPDGVVFIDPTKPAAPVLKKLENLGEPIAILLTNAHHDRDADWFRKTYQIQIYAHEKARPNCDTKLDVLVLDGEKLPGGLRAIYMPGSSDSETAYYHKAGGIVFTGDTLLNLPDKGLSLLPDPYIEDRKQALQSLRKLLELNFKIITFAHGDPIVENAKRHIASFLKHPRKKSR